MAPNVAHNQPVVEFGDLPAKRGGGSAEHRDWDAIAAMLRTRPGSWARIVINTVDTTLTSRIKGGEGVRRISAFRGEVYEAALRNTREESGRRVGDVWARYMGPEA